jgi:hypothetical protein
VKNRPLSRALSRAIIMAPRAILIVVVVAIIAIFIFG